MKFTVAICTWNRASLLSRVLTQLARIHHPACAWEVVVVNNNSTDDTERVLDAFAGRLALRPVFEHRPGLSHARNAAVGQATGDYIVWTDDDALVDVSWLAAYRRAVERRPEAAVFGGPVRPQFEGTPPPWLSAAWLDIQAAFATRDLGAEPFELDIAGELPYGANFVVRARAKTVCLRPYPRKKAGGRRSRRGDSRHPSDPGVGRHRVVGAGCGGRALDSEGATNNQIPAKLLRSSGQNFSPVGRTRRADALGAPPVALAQDLSDRVGVHPRATERRPAPLAEASRRSVDSAGRRPEIATTCERVTR